jgi:O-antigen/teichoic acid export membrane protein
MIRSTGALLARNTLYNFATQIIVSVVAFVSIPVIVSRIGDIAFGILTLIWMIVGYFGILDLGVGQASVKFLSEHLSKGEKEEANSTVWAAVGVSAVVGILTSLLVIGLTPYVLNGTVEVPDALQDQTRLSCYLLSIAIPFVMLQGAFRAVPMAVQRFDLFNLMIGLTGLLQWGGSLLLVILGKGLVDVVILTVGIRMIGAYVAYQIASRLFPELSFRRTPQLRRTVKKLLKFGGWLTLSQAVSPVTRYLDRVFVVTYHSLRVFTYYTVPYEALSRLQVVPMSLSTTLFPAMSEREGIGGRATSFPLFMRALNMTILVMLPLTLGLIAFSKLILGVWLGGEFPELSNSVFRILSMAVFVQAICYVPLTSLQAIGRPDLATKYYLVEAPFYIILCYVLVPWLGIEGAALAFCCRMITNAICFFVLAYRSLGSPRVSIGPVRNSLLLNCGLAGCLLFIANTWDGALWQLLGSGFVGLIYAGAAWVFSLDNAERYAIKGIIVRPFRSL